MELSWACAYPPLMSLLVFAFCVLSPFALAALLRRRVTSPVAVDAALLELAVVQCGVWLALANVIKGLSIAGGGRAVRAAGIAEALGGFVIVAFPIALIALFSLVRRLRPIVDRVTAAIAAALAIQIIATLLFAARIAPIRAQVYVALACVAIALLTAVAAAVRLFLVHRGSVAPRPLRGGLSAVVLAFATLFVMIWQQMRQYVQIAMSG